MLRFARWESTEATPARDVAQDLTEGAAPVPIRYPYFVARVGAAGTSLPVYSDIRHGGSQWLTQIRKVEGDAAVRIGG